MQVSKDRWPTHPSHTWVNTKEPKVRGVTIVESLGLARGVTKLNCNTLWVKWTWLRERKGNQRKGKLKESTQQGSLLNGLSISLPVAAARFHRG